MPKYEFDFNFSEKAKGVFCCCPYRLLTILGNSLNKNIGSYDGCDHGYNLGYNDGCDEGRQL